MDAVVLQQHGLRRAGFALEADQLGRVLQAGGRAVGQADDQLAAFDAVAGGVDVGSAFQRCGFVEEVTGEGDDLGAAHRVVALAFLGAVFLADRVGAVQRVVQRAPAGVGGVEGEARVHHRHHQLRAGHAGDLVVDVFGGDGEVRGLRQQVADFLQEGLVGNGVVGLTGTRLVPGVDLRLQGVALGQQGLVLRGQVVNQGVGTLPELLGADAGAGNGFVGDEVEQDFGDLQATGLNAFSHCLPHSAWEPHRTAARRSCSTDRRILHEAG
ncbi:hypothetical protein D9M71_313780 [compost metagenome]